MFIRPYRASKGNTYLDKKLDYQKTIKRSTYRH